MKKGYGNKQNIEDRLDFGSVLYKVIDKCNEAGLRGNLRDFSRAVLVLYFNLSPWIDGEIKKEWNNHKKVDNLSTWFHRLELLLKVADGLGLLLDKKEIDEL